MTQLMNGLVWKLFVQQIAEVIF